MSLSSNESGSNSESTDIDFQTIFGKILNNNYLVFHVLGQGSYAVVWMAYDIKKDKFCAIKMQNPEDSKHGEREVNFFKKIHKSCEYLTNTCDNFVCTIENNTYICMVLELMAGSVFDLIRQGKYENGLPLNVVKIIMKQLLIAMDVLITKFKIVHTDIKPDNILLYGVSKKCAIIIEDFNKQKFKNKYKNYKKKLSDKESKIRAAADVLAKMKTLDKFEDDIDESSENSEANQECLIDDSFIDPTKLLTKLSDFGSILNFDDLNHEIQTRYYRSPEAILKYDINEKTDMWSVGCILYELLTGELLFDPDKLDGFDRDKKHIFDFQSILGCIPNELLQKAKKYKLFFKENGQMKGINQIINYCPQFVDDELQNYINSQYMNEHNIKYVPLSKLMENKLKSRSDINTTDINMIISLMYKLLDYNCNYRLSPSECLIHDFFN